MSTEHSAVFHAKSAPGVTAVTLHDAILALPWAASTAGLDVTVRPHEEFQPGEQSWQQYRWRVELAVDDESISGAAWQAIVLAVEKALKALSPSVETIVFC